MHKVTGSLRNLQNTRPSISVWLARSVSVAWKSDIRRATRMPKEKKQGRGRSFDSDSEPENDTDGPGRLGNIADVDLDSTPAR